LLQEARKNEIWLQYFPGSLTKIDKDVLEILALGGKQSLYRVGKELYERGHSKSSAVYSLRRLGKLGLAKIYFRERSKKLYGLTALGFYVYIIVCDKNFKDIYCELDLIAENYPDLFPIFSRWKSRSFFLKDYAKQRLINVACELATRGFLLSAAIKPGDLRIPEEVNKKLKEKFWAYLFTHSFLTEEEKLRFIIDESPLVSVFEGFKHELELHFSETSSLLRDMVDIFLNFRYSKRLKLKHALTLLKLKIFYWVSRVLLTLL